MQPLTDVSATFSVAPGVDQQLLADQQLQLFNFTIPDRHQGLLTFGAHAQRGLQYSVCLSVCERVCYLANSCAVNVQVQRKIRIESKCGTKGF